jgi:hypothetical protein
MPIDARKMKKALADVEMPAPGDSSDEKKKKKKKALEDDMDGGDMADPIRAGRIKRVLRELKPPMAPDADAPEATPEDASPLLDAGLRKKKKKPTDDETGTDIPTWIQGHY